MRIQLLRGLVALTALLTLAACQSQGSPPSNDNGSGAGPRVTGPGGKKPVSPLRLSSSALDDGASIPSRFTCEGPGGSPPLHWTGAPRNTRSFALLVEDPDAPGGVFTHWVAFNLPSTSSGLPENIPSQPSLRDGGRQGTNDFKKIGYGAPCPPKGEHRYFFRLYALNATLRLGDDAGRQQLLDAMQRHVLAQASFMGRYRKDRQ